jgi:hypothetical protein
MFCRGSESPRAIKIPDPMPAVGPFAAAPYATGGRSAGRPAGSWTGRDGERPGPPWRRPCQHVSMHAGQELLPFGSAHGDPPDGDPSER